jgi:peptide/nickel transport system permease protein
MADFSISLFPFDVQKPSKRENETLPKQKFQLQQAGPFLGYLLSRVVAGLVTFLIITAAVYAISLLIPVDERVRLYIPEKHRYEEVAAIRQYLDIAIEQYGLDDPFPIQYGRWLGNLARGDWGTSALLRQNVLDVIILRSPATIELTLYSILIYIPIGLLLGAYTAWKKGQPVDQIIRTTSFVFTAIPPFVLGFFLIALVYVQLHLLDLSRIG